MNGRIFPTIVGLFAAIGAWVVGRALGQRLAGSGPSEPNEPKPHPELLREIEDAVEVSPKGEARSLSGEQGLSSRSDTP